MTDTGFHPAPGFRDYANASPGVREFYRQNHAQQTLAFARHQRERFATLDRMQCGAWEACLKLDTLIDDSDPDINLSQLTHLLQTAEAIRAAGHPRWLVLTGLVHDLGKLLCLFDEPQWAVTGDTFPLGCRFSEDVVLHEFFAANPDSRDPALSTEFGIYEPGIGLDNVTLSWGHDEYGAMVFADHLPEEAVFVIRYHSFYRGPQGRAYDALLSARDRKLMHWVDTFHAFDLYSKHDEPPNVAALEPYYRKLIDEFLPPVLKF